MKGGRCRTHSHFWTGGTWRIDSTPHVGIGNHGGHHDHQGNYRFGYSVATAHQRNAIVKDPSTLLCAFDAEKRATHARPAQA